MQVIRLVICSVAKLHFQLDCNAGKQPNPARKRVEERRRKGEEVDESEIEQAACEEYRRDPHGEDKDKSTTANDYEAYSSDGEEIVEGLQLPVIYDTVLPDGHDAITENPMFNKVKAKIEEGECTMVVPAT